MKEEQKIQTKNIAGFMDSNVKHLYDAMISQGYTGLGDFSNFEGKMKDSGKRRMVYDYLIQDDYFSEIGDFSKFESALGYSPAERKDYVSQSGVNPAPIALRQEADVPMKDQSEYVNPWTNSPDYNFESLRKKGKIETSTPPPPTEYEKDSSFMNTWAGDAIQKLNAGGADLGAGIFGVLDKVSKGLESATGGLIPRGGAFKDISDRFKADAEFSRARSNRYNGKDFTDLWKEGNYMGAIGDIALQGVESLPMSIGAMAATMAGAPAAGLAGIGSIVASQKYDDLDQNNPNMGEFAKVSNAILTGTAESLSEMLGAGVSKAWMSTLFKTLGKEKAQEAIKRGIMGKMQEFYKKFGMFFEPVNEGIEEVSSTLAENITDKITGADPERDLTDGVLQSFVYGMGGGAYFTGAGALAKGAQYVADKTGGKQAQQPITDSNVTDQGVETPPLLTKSRFAEAEEQGRNMTDPGDIRTASKKMEETRLSLSEMVPGLVSTIESYVDDGASEAQVMSLLDGVNADARPLAEDFYADYLRISGLQDRIGEEIDNEVETYVANNITPYVTTNPDGQSIVTTATLSEGNVERPVYVRSIEGDKAVISDNGQDRMVSVKRLSDIVEQDAGHMRRTYEDQLLATRQSELDMTMNHNPKTQLPKPGLIVWNGDNAFILQGQDENGDWIAQPAAYDRETGQVTAKNGSSPAMPITENEILDLQDAIYDAQQVNVVSPEDDNVASADAEITSAPPVEDAINQPTSEIETEGAIDQIAQPSNVENPSMVMREDGTPDFVSSGTDMTLDFLHDKYGDKMPRKIEVTRKSFDESLKKASDALEKAQEAYDDTPIGKEDKAEAALIKARQEYEAIKVEADFWANLDDDIKEASKKPGDVIAKDISVMGDPMSGEELAAMMLANGAIKLTRDSYKKETGAGNNETARMFGLFASPEKGGVNIERAGEILELADKENGTNFFDENDTNAGRDAIIEVLSSAHTRGDLIDYVKRNREAIAERERQAEYNAYTEWCEENYHMSPEEYEAYEESMVRDFSEKQLTDEERGELDSQIVDEIQAIIDEQNEIDAILAQNKPIENENIEGNDESGGDGLREGGGEVLPREQLDQTGGTGEVEGKESAGPDIDRTDGVTQESASGEVASKNNATGNNWLDNVPNDGRNYFVYVRFPDENRYRAIDLGNGRTVDRLAFASMVKRERLQSLVGILPAKFIEGVSFQIRDAKGNVFYEYDPNKKDKPFVPPSQKKNENPLDYAERIVEAKRLHEEELKVDTNPTEAQKEAGNYKKGHIKINGFDVTIEQPSGSVRSGKDASGKEWSQVMNNTYGYIRGTESVDGDHIDVFLGPDMNSDMVYVVDQVNTDGSFDEHKVMMGFPSLEDARSAYFSNYEDGWQGLGNITGVALDEFKKWIDSSTRKTKPFYEYKGIKQEESDISKNNDSDNYSIVPSQYTTKKGKVLDMRLLKFGNELSKEQQRAAKELAKAEKGWYDREQRGFMMRSDESARRLADTILGDTDAVSDAQPISLEDTRRVVEPQKVNVENLIGDINDKGKAKLSDRTVTPSGNRLVTDERYAELRERMRRKLGGQMNMGVDPEILAIGTEMAVYHIEKGLRKFSDYSKAMIDDLGDAIRPYLKAFYNGARDLPEVGENGWDKDMTTYEDVRSFDVANFDKPVPDIMDAAETVVRETEIAGQAIAAKKKIKNSRKKQTDNKDKPLPLYGNDLFTPNNIKDNEQGNSRADQGVGRKAREEDRGSERGGDRGGVHGSDVLDTERGRGIPISDSDKRPVVRNQNNFSFPEKGIELPSGDISKLKANIEAIETLKDVEDGQGKPTPEQQAKMSRYVGWGGLAEALNEGKYNVRDNNWTKDRNWNDKYLRYYEKLKSLLSKEEFDSAVRSTTTSHYTPSEVVESLWGITEKLGFKGGNISEPAMGIGNIIGMMPRSISENSSISGFEIDSLSGRMAKALYPDANIKVQGYEKAFFPNSKDLVITNVPFGKNAPYDKVLDKQFRKKLGSSYNLHNYFILKGLLELKEGGLGVFVTSSATMDGADSKFREYVSGNGYDLVGAIRLPNDAFQKGAGTSVTADIVIFRKRKYGEPSNGIGFTTTTQIGEGTYMEDGDKRSKPIMVNEYFSNHPDMMLGDMMTAYDAGSGGLYSGASQTLKAKPGADLSKELFNAIDNLPKNILSGVVETKEPEVAGDSTLKNGTITVQNGNVFVLDGDSLKPIKANPTFVHNGKTRKIADAVNDYNDIKKNLYDLIHDEQTKGVDPEPARKRLNKVYDAFVYKYGTLNRNKALDDIFAEDVEHGLPFSLETVRRVPSTTGKSMVWEVSKADGILNKRVSYPFELPTKADNVLDAVNISKSYKGNIDIPYISKITGMDEVNVAPDILDAYNINSFDEFATTFGTVEPSLEFTATGNFKIAERFKSYTNVPELIKAFRSHTDVVLTEDVKEFKEDKNIPKLKDNKMTNVIVEKNEDLEDVMQTLIKELEDYNKLTGKEKKDKSALPLVVFSKAKQAAIDLRLLNPTFPDNPDSKTNKVVDNVLRLYKESDKDKGTQLIFCDSYQSPSETPKMDLFDVDLSVPQFNLYNDIKEKLTKGGIPSNQIAIVGNYEGERRNALFDKVRNGDVRILIGSTEKMGVGVNVQDRLFALHHIDAPIRPMDFEQRNGRILRQGNLYATWDKPVNIVTYGVKGTLDATAYDRLRIKQNFINQMMKGDISSRVMEEQDDSDPSGMTFSEMAATLSGDKTAQLLFVAQNKLKKLQNSKRSDLNSKSSMRDSISNSKLRIQEYNSRKDIMERNANIVKENFPDGVESVTVKGNTFSDGISNELTPIIDDYYDRYTLDRNTPPLKISLNGGKGEAIVHFNEGMMVYSLYLGKEKLVENRDFSGGRGLMASIDRQLGIPAKSVSDIAAKIKAEENKIAGLEEAVKKPWGKEDELNAAQAEVNDLQRQLVEKAKAEDIQLESTLDVDGTLVKEEGETRFRFMGVDTTNNQDNVSSIESSINDWSNKLNTPVRVIHDVDDINDTDENMLARKRDSKGWYDTSTGEIVIVSPNSTSVGDAQRTFLHEVVGHHGLRELFRDDFDTFLDNVYRNANEDIRKNIIDRTKGNPLNLREATEEYIAELAERGFDNKAERSLWEKIKDSFLDMLRKAGISLDFKLSDNNLRYILWRSYKNLEQGNLMDVAEDIVMRNRLGLNNINLNENGSIERDIEPEKGKQPSETKGTGRELETIEGVDENGNESERDHIDKPRGVENSIDGTENATDRNGRETDGQVDNDGDQLDGGDTVDRNGSVRDGIDGERTVIGRAGSENKGRGVGESVREKTDDFTFAEKTIRFRENAWNESVLFADNDIQVVEKQVGSAKDQYERTLSTSSYQFQEAFQDSMLGLKTLQDAVAKATRSRILDYENAYMAENALSSVNEAEFNAYRKAAFEPILKAMSRLEKMGSTIDEIRDYLITKHGIERNREMAVKRALSQNSETYKSLLDEYIGRRNEIRENGRSWEEQQSEMDRLAEEYGANLSDDFSGFTSMYPNEDNTGYDPDSARRYVLDYESRYDTSELSASVKRATDAILAKQRDSGLMSQNTFDSISDMYQFYVPLRGWEETTADEVYAYLTSESQTFNAPIKTVVGRKSKADDPIATIANMAESGIMQGNRNLMKQKFLTMVQNHKTDLVSVSEMWVRLDEASGEWIAVFPDIPSNANPEQVESIVESFNKRMEELSNEKGSNVRRSRDAIGIPYKILPKDLKEHQVIVKRAGKEYLLTINGNPRAAQALNGLTNPDNTKGWFGTVERYAGWLNRNLAANFTTRNPNFMVSNFLRDALYSNTTVWVKESPVYAWKFNKNFAMVNPINMYRLVKGYENGTLDMSDPLNKAYHDFVMRGGETGYTNLRDVEAKKKAIQKELQYSKQKVSIGKTLKILGEWMDLFNKSVENCARFAAFLTSREMGRSMDKSIYDAKEISVNFNKKGAGSKFLNTEGQTKIGNASAFTSGLSRSMYVFWNAGVQGMYNFGRLAKDNPKKFLGLASSFYLLGTIMPMLAAAFWDDEDDDYYDLPEYVRRNNICFRNGGGNWITIPMPIELRAIYGLGEMSSGIVSGKEKYTDKKMAMKIAEQMSQVLPLDMMEGGGGFSAFVPSSVKPLIEAGDNKDWTGLPLYKDNDFNKGMPEWTKAFKSVDPAILAMTKYANELTGGDKYTTGTVNLNPAIIEHILDGYFGGIEATRSQMVKSAETAWGSRDFDWRNIPVGNRLIKSGDERTKKKAIDNAYYENLEEMDKIGQRLRGYRKELSNPQNDSFDIAEYQKKLNDLMMSDEYRGYVEFNNLNKLYQSMGEYLKKVDDERLEMELYDLKAMMNEIANGE